MDDDIYTGKRLGDYRGPRKNLIGCRLIGCSCFLFIVISCIFSVFMFVARPQTLWGYVADFVNDGLTTREYISIDPKLVQNRINSQITNFEEIKLILNEDEVTSLARQSLPSFKNLVVDLKENKILFTWDLFAADDEKPVKGLTELELKDQSLILNKLGTKRIDSPDFLKRFIAQMFLSKLNLGNENLDTGFLGSVFSSSQIRIQSVEITEFDMTINGKISLDLFN